MFIDPLTSRQIAYLRAGEAHAGLHLGNGVRVFGVDVAKVLLRKLNKFLVLNAASALFLNG